MIHFQTVTVSLQIITNVYLEIQMVNGATLTDVMQLLNIGEFNNIVTVMFKTLGVAALHLAIYSNNKPILPKMNVKEQLEKEFVFILILDNVQLKVIILNMMILYLLNPWH